jgi:hypothetical protein
MDELKKQDGKVRMDEKRRLGEKIEEKSQVLGAERSSLPLIR